MREATRGKRVGKNNHFYGKHHTEEFKREKSEFNKGENNYFYGIRRFGKDNPNWKGGITQLQVGIRTSFLYRQWRSDIFTRDDFTCQKCNRRGGNLHAHHIKPFALIFELNDITTLKQAKECSELWDINNGITYCQGCHSDIERAKQSKKESYTRGDDTND